VPHVPSGNGGDDGGGGGGGGGGGSGRGSLPYRGKAFRGSRSNNHDGGEALAMPQAGFAGTSMLMRHTDVLLLASLIAEDVGAGIAPASFISCADVITGVSAGTLRELKAAKIGIAALTGSLLTLRDAQHRAIPVPNAVSDALWDAARVVVPLADPIAAKAAARAQVAALMAERSGRAGESGGGGGNGGNGGDGGDGVSGSSGDGSGGTHNDGVPQLRCIVLFIGRLETNKGVPTLPSAQRAVCDAGCGLVVMGTQSVGDRVSESVVEELKAAAHANSTCHTLFVLDRALQSRVGDLVRAAADVVIVPSRAEAYGLVAAEALAYGSLPVVSSAGGLPEIVVPYSAAGSSKAASQVWTGIVFESDNNDWDATAANLVAALHTSLVLVAASKDAGTAAHEALLRRLIAAAPRWRARGGSIDKLADVTFVAAAVAQAADHPVPVPAVISSHAVDGAAVGGGGGEVGGGGGGDTDTGTGTSSR